ncbi:MAG TPA: glycosyl hydrolase [Candidatus Dormibacteraeota bacterium]|nr:glycosyl hydrolase [Candidatus Dormibacteraeota bacterium]
MRRLLLLFASASVLVVGSLTPAFASGGNGPHDNAGQESQDAANAADWFAFQRLAPNGAVNPNAYAAVAAQAGQLSPVGGAWSERTNLSSSAGVDFSDSPTYIDPTSNFSNSGAGDRYVAGRMTSLAASPDGTTLFAGAADGGVWRSTNAGATWTPVFDSQGTLSIGALLTVPTTTGYTLYAGTGEANTSSDSYAGIGVLASSDAGNTWTRVGGSDAISLELNGATIFRIAQDGNAILAATSHGLFSHSTTSNTGAWTMLLQPAGPPPGPNMNFNLKVGNMITDVAVRPGTNGQTVLAVAGWRSGAPTNGLYLSGDAGAHFSYLSAPTGWPSISDEGRTTLAYSAKGDRLYAVIQSPFLLNVGTNGKTLLTGAFASASGDANGPWTQIAQSEQLANSGSAQNFKRIGTKGYGPGIQAWYNQFLAVDPADGNHVYLGLEEVYESQNGGGKWNTIAPYWNFGFSCFSYSPFEGTCNHNQAHSDQHAALVVNGKLYVGNDGGVYARSLSDHAVGNWDDLNTHLDVLQYYSATSAKDGTIYGGLQDNGSNKVFTTPTNVTDDQGHQISVSSVQVFGGDGGYTLVDPNDSNKVITEYTGLTALSSIDGGKNWNFIVPPDPDPRFISPIEMDRTNSNHLVSGGAIVWNAESGITTNVAWTNIFDVRTATGSNVHAEVTALDAFTAKDGTQYVAAAWCGPCNVTFGSGTGFHAGIVMLSNSGGSWHATKQVASCSGPSSTTPCPAGMLPNRYISGVRIDTANPSHAYLTLSGYSRRWMIGPDDPGVGHVFESKDGGGTWNDVSAGLPDVPMDDLVLQGSGRLDVATDFGVYTSTDDGATWSRLGSGLPNVVVDQLTLDPTGTILVAATHGRGVWTMTAP